MKSPFLCDYKVTHPFGEKRDGYKQKYNLEGHEGVDIVPKKLDWGVHAIEGGTVILDDDDGGRRGSAYGVSVRVQTPDGRVYLYAHLSENTVDLGDEVAEGQLIGIMGDSGNSFGAHLHLGVYRVSPTGVRLNAGNGYKGYLDPEKEVP